MNNDPTMALVIVGLFLLSLIAACAALIGHERRRAATTWQVIAEGEFDRAEYGEFRRTRRSGSMVHTTSVVRFEVTALFMADGRSYVLNGRHDAPFPKGTRIRLWRNCYDESRIEKI